LITATKETSMPHPHGDSKHFGRGTQPKGDGTGAMTDIDKDKIGDNAVLSNRDKSRHTRERGLDGNQVKTEQYQDHAGNRLTDEKE
jgi:hypothetical protein